MAKPYTMVFGETATPKALAPSMLAKVLSQSPYINLTLPLPLNSSKNEVMETIYRIPTPKQSRKELSRDDRLRIQTLFCDAGWTCTQISFRAGISYGQIQYTLRHRITPKKQKTGRKVLFVRTHRRRSIWSHFDNTTKLRRGEGLREAHNWDIHKRAA